MTTRHLQSLLLLSSLWAFGAGPASAQTPPALDAQHFQPHADRTGWFVTDSARTLELWQPAFGLYFSYARNPVAYYVDGALQDRVVGDLATMDLQAAVGFGPADLGISVPVHVGLVGDGLADWGGAVSGSAMGDIRLVPKIRFLDPGDEGFGLGLALPLSLPSGNEEKYLGLSTVAFCPAVLLTGHVGAFRFGGNLGVRLTKKEEVDDLVAGNAFLFRVGASFHPAEQVDVVAEIYGDVHSQPRNNPTEWLLGAKIHPIGGLDIALAGGSSMGPGIGSPEGRLVFGVGYTVPRQQDADGDGIPDASDGCPEQPEDVDGFQDDDGCPDDDNDGDGIPDGNDACPDEPETVNGYDDADGCPDAVPDTDGDGFPDDRDKCPNEPEDVDGFQDDDGCPDNDHDGDGIPNDQDKCPDEPEVYNNVDDDDGCPDEGRVKLEKKEIVILEKVFFDTNKAIIKERSLPLLDDVAAILIKFPRIKKLEVQGHTDEVGSDEHNMKLSRARAAAVTAYLVSKGVEESRLVPVGYGETMPLDPGKNKAAYEKNRRVQFVILEQDTD